MFVTSAPGSYFLNGLFLAFFSLVFSIQLRKNKRLLMTGLEPEISCGGRYCSTDCVKTIANSFPNDETVNTK